MLRTESDGSLARVPGGVVSSGDVDPVSIAVHGNLVYVVNAGPAAPSLTGFVLTPFGRLIALPHATFPLPANSQPGEVLFNSTGTKLAATLIASSQIASYTVGNDGYLNAAAGSPYPGQGLGALQETDPDSGTPTPMARRRRAGSPSPRTGATCSRSTPVPTTSHATRSPRTGR